jgi:hypothetical protein
MMRTYLRKLERQAVGCKGCKERREAMQWATRRLVSTLYRKSRSEKMQVDKPSSRQQPSGAKTPSTKH